MNQTEKKLFQSLTDHDDKVLAGLFTTFNFDPDYFEETFLPALLGIDMEDEVEATLKTLDIVHSLEQTPIAILMDSRANLNVHRKIPNYDVRPIWDTTQHSKVSLLAFEDSIKLVISSGNLNSDGIHRNKEVYVELNLKEESDEWKVLEDVILYLKKMILANQIQSLKSLDILEQKFLELKPDVFQASNLKFQPVSPVGDKVMIPEAFKSFWDANGMDKRVKAEILSVHVQAPFYETSATSDHNMILQINDDIEEKLKQKEGPEFFIYLPTKEGKLLTLVPAAAYTDLTEVYFYENEALRKDFRFPHLKTFVFTDNAYYCLYMLGSSNFSPSAFGYTKRKKPNWEANLLFFKKDFAKKDISSFYPRDAKAIDNLTEREVQLIDDLTGEEDLTDPVIIQASFEKGILKVELLKDISEGMTIILDQTILNAAFKLNRLELLLEHLTTSYLLVMKGDELYQSFPIAINDLSFDEHIKMIPQDMIVKFIEARYKYNREIRPSEIILEERRKAIAALNPDLKIDTSQYLLYEIKAFNIFMANLYDRLKDSAPYLNQVKYHLNGKFGIQHLIIKYLEEAKGDKTIQRIYQAMETITQALLAFEGCQNKECINELNSFYSSSMQALDAVILDASLDKQMVIYKSSVENLKIKIFEKVEA